MTDFGTVVYRRRVCFWLCFVHRNIVRRKDAGSYCVTWFVFRGKPAGYGNTGRNRHPNNK